MPGKHEVDVSHYFLNPAEIAFFTSADIYDLTIFLADSLGAQYHDVHIEDQYFDNKNLQMYGNCKSLRLRTYTHQLDKLDIIDVNWQEAKGGFANDIAIRGHSVYVQSLTGITSSEKSLILKKLESSGNSEVFRLRKIRRTFEVKPARFTEVPLSEPPPDYLITRKENVRSFRCTDNGLTVLLDTVLACSSGSFSNIIEIEFDTKYRKKAMTICRHLIQNFGNAMAPKKRNKIEYVLAAVRNQDRKVDLPHLVPEYKPTAGRINKTGLQNKHNNPIRVEFLPGEHLHVKEKWKRPARPKSAQILVNAPGRLHFFAWNPAKFSFAKPGGGGLGISTAVASNYIEISVGMNKDYCPPSAVHLKKLFCKLVGYDENQIGINLRSAISEVHGGLGSNVSLNTGLLAGLNTLFGSPFSSTEVYDILIHNYVENSGPQSIVQGVDTGVGEASLLYGGLVWVDENGHYSGSVPTPTLYGTVSLGIRDELIKKGNTRSSKTPPYGASLLLFESIAMHKLRPNFARGDLWSLLHEAWMSTPLALRLEKGSYDLEIYSAFSKIVKDNGGLCAGISSEGPIMFGLADDRSKAEVIARNIEKELSKYFSVSVSGKAGNPLSTTIKF